jgi:enterochelin esterase-like enzyme
MGNYGYRPRRWRDRGLLFVLVTLVCLAASGCSGSRMVELPTVASVAAAVTPTPAFSVVITRPSAQSLLPPATFTAEPTPSITPTPLPSATAEPTASATPCATGGEVVRGSYASQIAGPQRAYRIYLPPCYGVDGRVYPTLYMLHGNATNDSHWDLLGLDEAATEGITAGLLPPLLIVMPDGGAIANNSSGGAYSFEGVVLNELIPFVESNYCAWGDGAGRAIGGLSRGGYWALEIALRHPAEFSGVGGHSAALVDSYAGPDLNPPSTVLSGNLGSLRIYLDIGDQDGFLGPLRQMHESMVTAGVPHTWVLNSGRHEDGYWAAHVGEYLAWYTEMWPMERGRYGFCERGEIGE